VQPNQADSELKQGRLLNFVVDALDSELPLDLGEEVEITPDEPYEDLDQSHLQDDGGLTTRQYRP